MQNRNKTDKKTDKGKHPSILGIERSLTDDVHKITVALIGCGGTGSLIATRMARIDFALKEMGLKGLHLIVYDDDIVEPHNVGRQMFGPNDVGSYKAISIVDKINRSFNLNWDAFVKRAKKCPEFNFIITAVDNVQSRKYVQNTFYDHQERSHLFSKKMYWIDCGNGKDFGQVVLSDHKHTLANIFDVAPDIERDSTNIEIQGAGCSYMDKLNEQDLFINDEMAIIASDMLWLLIRNKYLDYNVVYTNKKTMERKKVFISI